MSKSKRGLAWPWNNKPEDFSLYTGSSKLTWLYNWELWKPDHCLPSLDYVPQVRTAKEAGQIDQFLGGLWPRPKIEGEERHFLGFNEPDIKSQANMDIDAALKLWKMHVEPAKGKFGFRLGSPSVSS